MEAFQKKLNQLIADSNLDEAMGLVENKLQLGPKNLAALKQKAYLHKLSHDFAAESKTWEQIAENYPDDLDASKFFQYLRIEAFERNYFVTDKNDLRSYKMFPMQMIYSSASALLGCLVFLTLPALYSRLGVDVDANISLVLFCLLVMGPWFYIAADFFKCKTELEVGPTQLRIKGRLRSDTLEWSDVSQIEVLHSRKIGAVDEIIVHSKAKVLSIKTSGTRNLLKAQYSFLSDLAQFNVPIVWRHCP